MNTTANDCSVCQRSGMSLLLLRPSPIATHSDLQAPGSSSAQADPALVNPYLPTGLTESRPVLRLLRVGYVHLYIPKTQSWRSYSVTPRGEVLAQDHPSFGNPHIKTCRRDGHNAAGFKLLQIPDAHTLMGQSIWLAFSPNQWSDKLKAQNKANPKAMVEVKLGSATAPAFKPDVTNLKRQVLECNVLSWRVPKVEAPLAPLFAFNSMAYEAQAQQLADALRQAAAHHPKTSGHELAVVLPDALGYAAELNALRLARFEFLKQDMAKPSHAHALNSLQTLDGLRQCVVDEQEAKSYESICPVMNRGAFENIIRVRPNPRGWPPGTRWEPITERQALLQHGPGSGRVIFPDHAQRAQEWAAKASARNWLRYKKYVDEGRLQSWKSSFDKAMQAQHGEPQKRLEADWWRARQHSRFAEVLALHFDDNDPNRVGDAQTHCPGAVYAEEVQRCLTPQPMVQGDALDGYLAELMKPATDPNAPLQRALAGNQSLVLTALQAYAQESRPDKLHDLGSGLLKGADAATLLGRGHLKYAWTLHAAYGASTLAITAALSAALSGSKLLLSGALASSGTAGAALMERLNVLLMATHAMQLARDSALKGTRLQVPVRFMVRLPLADALAAQQQALQTAGHGAGPALSQAEQALRARVHKDGMVRVPILSTNLALHQLQGNVQTALAAGTAHLDVGASAAALPVVQLSRKQYLAMLQRQATVWEKTASALRESMQSARGATLTLDGQIGMVALLLNGWSVYNTASSSKTDWADWDTRFAFADSSAGTLGGLLQVTQAAIGTAIAYRAGGQAAQRSLWVMGLGAAASFAGAFGGLATAAGQFVKAYRSEDTQTSRLYAASGIAFFSQGSVGSIQFIGAFSEFMMAKGSERAIWMYGSRMAAGASARLLAWSGLGLTGWGLVLLGAGLVFEVGVVMLTPDALQKHIEKSYFGTGAERYSSLTEEQAALVALSAPQVVSTRELLPQEDSPPLVSDYLQGP